MGSDSKESICNARDLASIPGERNGYPHQYSGLENSMDKGAWQATVHGVAKSQTGLSDFHFHFCIEWCLNTFVWEVSLHLLPKLPTPWMPFYSLSIFTLKPFRIKPFLLYSRKSRISQLEETYIWFNCESVMQVPRTALASLTHQSQTTYI